MRYKFYPQNKHIPSDLEAVVDIFKKHEEDISSSNHTLNSNTVLSKIAEELESIGFLVETGKEKNNKVTIPVLFGENNAVTKSFDVDAYHEDKKIILEVEAGRAIANYQSIKDLLEASIIDDIDYLIIALRNTYKTGRTISQDFDKLVNIMDSVYSSRLKLPLKGVLIIGY